MKMEQGDTSMPFWSEEKLTHLQAQLTGPWAEDNWPLLYRNKKKQLVERFLHFSLVSSSLKVEFKYALWYHLDRGMWKTPNS